MAIYKLSTTIVQLKMKSGSPIYQNILVDNGPTYDHILQTEHYTKLPLGR